MTSASRMIRLARTLHRHWQQLPPEQRRQMGDLADEVKQRALDLRGRLDGQAAARELEWSMICLSAAIIRAAEADPEMSPEDVDHLCALLKREVARVDQPGRVRAA